VFFLPDKDKEAMRATEASMQELRAARDELLEQVRALIPSGDVDENQVAANELAWAYAGAEAAEACDAWAQATGDPLARTIADAAISEGLEELGRRAGRKTIAWAPMLERITLESRSLADIGASEEQRMLRSTFRDFARSKIAPHAAAIHRGDLDIPEGIIRDLSELGVFGLSIPEAYGGSQGRTEDFESMLIVTEELSYASLAAGGSLITRPEILVRALLRAGTEEQKKRWLPAIASGRQLVAVATTEPDFGSDVAGLRCRADRTDSGWIVSGTKLWCTFAGRAELLMLLLRTGEVGHRGLSVFVLEKPAYGGHDFAFTQPEGGILKGRAIPTIGYRGMHTFELSFERFLLPEAALVGGDEWLDRGFYLQLESFAMGRLQTAGRGVGLMQAAVDAAADYTNERHVFGKPISAYGLPRATLGKMVMRVAASRQLSYRAARLVGRGEGQMEASLAKLYASRGAEQVTRDAMQLHGGMGYAEETDVSRYFVDARVLTIFEGAEDVLALRVIAKSLLRAG
jgi:(2S)-methylsuccinyl-CoA dehydrogenase